MMSFVSEDLRPEFPRDSSENEEGGLGALWKEFSDKYARVLGERECYLLFDAILTTARVAAEEESEFPDEEAIAEYVRGSVRDILSGWPPEDIEGYAREVVQEREQAIAAF